MLVFLTMDAEERGRAVDEDDGRYAPASEWRGKTEVLLTDTVCAGRRRGRARRFDGRQRQRWAALLRKLWRAGRGGTWGILAVTS